MRLAGTQYTLKDRAFEIYLSGCTIQCKGCHNPDLWDFEYGKLIDDSVYDKLIYTIRDSGKLVEEIRILGGEPLDGNPLELESLISTLRDEFNNKRIVLYTGYNLKEIKEKHPSVFILFDKIKFGRYIEELKIDGEELASSNQGIWFSSKELLSKW